MPRMLRWRSFLCPSWPVPLPDTHSIARCNQCSLSASLQTIALFAATVPPFDAAIILFSVLWYETCSKPSARALSAPQISGDTR
jgi:hypothetical protein